VLHRSDFTDGRLVVTHGPVSAVPASVPLRSRRRAATAGRPGRSGSGCRQSLVAPVLVNDAAEATRIPVGPLMRVLCVR
jgi:hypothetical protein